MRETRDRLRQAALFEGMALVIVAPLGGFVFGVSPAQFGVIALFSTTIAMVWAYLYNLAFDHALRRLGRSQHKSVPMRILHATLFEAGLLCVLAPLIAWYLQISLVAALVMDVSLSGFYLVYAFLFYWAYDLVFPLPPENTADGSQAN